MTTLALRFAPTASTGRSRLAFQVACAVAGVVLIAGLAQFTIYLPFTPVPITGQTLGVLLVGAAYGPALAAATVGLYLVAAVAGLPVLARNAAGGHDTGLHVLGAAFPSAGYLWGFLLAAVLVGWLARQGWDRSFRSSVSAMFFGEVVIYACGIPWLMHAVGVDVQTALTLGLYPFVVGDTIKLLLAAGALPLAWAALGRFGQGEGPGKGEEPGAG
jgi:biotin transport system substrate-specific component